MTFTVLPEFVQDSPEWHEARTTSLGASEVAAVLGLSPWQTPLSVWRTKQGIPNEINPDAAWWGHAHEDTIAKWIRDHHPEIGDVSSVGWSVRSDEHPWLTASPDRLITGTSPTIPVELKTDDGFNRDSWADAVPDYYRIQSIVQQGIQGAPYGWLAVLHGTKTAELIRIPFDPAVWEQIVRITGEWWQTHIVEGVVPEPSTSSEAVELWPGSEGITVEGGIELAELHGAYGLLQAEQIDIGQRLDGMRLELQKAMQDAVALTHNGVELFTWKPRKGATRLDSAALKAAHPDIHAEFMRTGEPTRTFLRKKTDD